MKGSLPTQASEFSSDTSGSVKLPDSSGNSWRKGELHAWLSQKPEPVQSCGMIPPMGKLTIAFLCFGIVSIILLTVGGGYYAIGKIQELSQQGSYSGYSGNDDTYVPYIEEEAVPEIADDAPVAEEAPAPIPDNFVTGVLAEDSMKLSSGEFAYQLDLTVQAGMSIVVDLTSPDFGTFLIVLGPNGEHMQNNDFEGNLNHSQVTFTAAEKGIYKIFATTSTIGETGGFRLEWTVAE